MALVHPNPYISVEDLKNAVGGANTFLALFDDDNAGTVSEAAVNLVRSRASTLVDSSLAKIYPPAVVPFLGQVPREAQEAALEYATGMSFLRRPEYAARYGEKGKVHEYERGDALCEALAKTMRRIADAPAAAPNPANVGVTVDFSSTDSSPGGVGGGIFSGGFGDY